MINVNKIRKDFPVLEKKKVIYFDSACMALKPVQVINALNDYYENFSSCAGRSAYKLSKELEEKVEYSRKVIARFFNAKENEIIFTKNTTESINLISHSLKFSKNDYVIRSDKEHSSNLVPWQLLEEQGKTKNQVIFSTEENEFNLSAFEEKLNELKGNARLVSIVHTSNLDGVTFPVKEIIKIAHDFNALVLVDAAQSAPHQEIDVKKLDIDFLACSGHKMLGPTGTGLLYGKKHLLEELNPFISGGDTIINSTYTSHQWNSIPEKFEAGLQDYAGIIGFSAAINYLNKIGMQEIFEHEIKLNEFISNELIDEVELIGPREASKRSGIFSFNIPKMSSHEVALMLDSSKNIAVRSGMHCVHSWFNAKKINGSVRASAYFYNNKEDAIVLIEGIKEIIQLIK